jgi:glycosyl transferase family 25
MEKRMIPLFVINLERERSKKEAIGERLDRLGISHTFVKAVDGRELDERSSSKVYSPDRAISIFKRELSRGEVGCALSHLLIYRKMIEEKIEKAVILEDDAVLCEDFPDILRHLDQLPEDCECLLFGYDADIAKEILLYTSFWGARKFYGKYCLKRFVKVAFGTYGYMITLRGAKKLLERIGMIDKPIDHYTGGLGSLNLYGLSPRCLTVLKEDLEKSSIVKERNELKKVLYAKTYNHWLTKWINRIRLGIRLFTLKILPLSIARHYSAKIFRNRRKDD